jgi:phytoene synthase
MNATPSLLVSNHFTSVPKADAKVDSDQVIKKASKSFHFASLLLPERIRPDITDLYAFMRYLDDLIDEDELCIEEKRYVVDQFCPLVSKDAQRKPYELNKDIMSKFNALQKKYGFGNEILMLFVEGLYWDLENKEYNSQQDLVQYCIRVAGTVGLFLCYIMGRKDEYTLYYACCLGKPHLRSQQQKKIRFNSVIL